MCSNRKNIVFRLTEKTENVTLLEANTQIYLNKGCLNNKC